MDPYLSEALDRAGRLGRRAPWVLAASFAAIAVIAVVDQLTGTRVSLAAIYAVPVGVLAWYFGRPGGHGGALLAASAELSADLLAPIRDPIALTVWNAGTVLVLCWIVAEVLTRLHFALDSERNLARTDALTGIANGRQMREVVEVELERVTRYGGVFTLAFLDLDHFKGVNDTLGHQTGDRLLREIAGAMVSRLRRVDVVARFGGDEFVLLLPETDAEAARTVLDSVRGAIRTVAEPYGDSVRASVGAVTYLEPPASVDDVLRRADAAMYEAKAEGRDRVVSVVVPVEEAAP